MRPEGQAAWADSCKSLSLDTASAVQIPNPLPFTWTQRTTSRSFSFSVRMITTGRPQQINFEIRNSGNQRCGLVEAYFQSQKHSFRCLFSYAPGVASLLISAIQFRYAPMKYARRGACQCTTRSSAKAKNRVFFNRNVQLPFHVKHVAVPPRPDEEDTGPWPVSVWDSPNPAEPVALFVVGLFLSAPIYFFH